ncbi:MAG: hypothetical protein J6R42_03050 [Clostridia bacterium]|nr:hypothetical protein [Clostridia bacterium]
MKRFIRSQVIVSLLLTVAMVFSAAILVQALGDDIVSAPTPWDGSVAESFAGGEGTESNPFLIETAAQLAFLRQSNNNRAEYYATSDGQIISSTELTVAVRLAGLAESGEASYTYYLFAYGEETYFYDGQTGIAHVLVNESGASATYSSTTYYAYVMGGDVFFAKTNPGRGKTATAYVYDPETGVMSETADLISNTNDNYSITDKGSTRTYSAENVYTFTYADGDAKVTRTLAPSPQTYKETSPTLHTITVDGATYYFMTEDGVLTHDYMTYEARADKSVKVTKSSPITLSGAYYNANYSLKADLSLNDLTNFADWKKTAPQNEWTPIGHINTRYFAGKFDGNGHTIHGIYISSTDIQESYLGLFGYVYGGELKSITLDHGYILARLFAGGFAAYVKSSNLTGLYNKGCTVYLQKGFYKHDTVPASGGIAGYATGSTIIRDCRMDAPTDAHNGSNTSGSGALDVSDGGIVGKAAGAQNEFIYIINCQNYGTVNGSNNHDYRVTQVGGIVGNASYTQVSGCYNEGDVIAASSGNSTSGGIVGKLDKSIVTGCINAGNISIVKGNKGASSQGAGGIVGNASGDSKTKALIQNNLNMGKAQNHENANFALNANSGTIAGYLGDNTRTEYNYTLPVTDTAFSSAIHGVKTNSAVVAENYEITPEHLTGESETIISAEGTYANTASLILAMNRFVKADNRTHTMTLCQGQHFPEAYREYSERYVVQFTGTEYGSYTEAAGADSIFPLETGLIAEGAAVGLEYRFRVNANDGYVIRSVSYTYDGCDPITLHPASDSTYGFVMPATDSLVISMNFVPVGNDIYPITYEDCELVSAWSAYPATAHFKGFDTVIPTPTRPNHHFAGWLVNDSTTPVMSLTLGAQEFSGPISLKATWTPKTLVTLDESAQSYVYDAMTKPFILLGRDQGLSGITVRYWVDGKWTPQQPLNAGVYDVRLTRAEDANYQSYDVTLTGALTVTLAPSSIVINDALDRVYNNTPSENPSLTVVGDGEVTLLWTTRDGVALSGAPTNAGLYTLIVSISRGQNYETFTVSKDFEISRATIDLGSFNWNYVEAYVYDTTEYSVFIVGLPLDVEVVYGGVYAATNAGDYTASATIIVDENNYYPISIDDLTWSITPAIINSLTLQWVVGDFVYDGREKMVYIEGLPSDITIAGYENNVKTNAGVYVATVTFNYNPQNYASVSIEPLTWEIEKATYDMSNLKWQIPDASFDGQMHTVELSGVPQGLHVEISGNSFVLAGEYRATAVFFGDANHYPVNPIYLEWSIEKAETVLVTPKRLTFVYTGNVQELEFVINHTEAKATYTADKELVAMGTYTVVVSVPESVNHKSAEFVVQVIIQESDESILARFSSMIESGLNAKTLPQCRQSMFYAYRIYKTLQNKDTEAVRQAVNRYGYLVNYYNSIVEKANETMAQGAEAAMVFTQTYIDVPVVQAMVSDIRKKFEE